MIVVTFLVSAILGGCAATTASTAEDGTCPIQETRNWHAWTDRGGTDGAGRLIVTGRVDAPNPGYEITLEPGPLDRRNPPSLRVLLKATPPDGPVIQVIDPRDVALTMPSKILHYRAILIFCGDHLVAELPEVMLTD